MNSNIFMAHGQISPRNKHIKCVENKILLQLLSNFVKIITFNELCVICNKNIQY